MNIVWLASYPKSGNTWLRFFLYAYIHGEISNSSDIVHTIPDIHKISGLNINAEGSFFIKTHGLCNPNHPYIKNTIKSIYIIRHPKDVLLSSLNYCKMEGDTELSDEEFAAEFITNLGVLKWKNVGMGNWVENVNSWISSSHVMNAPLLLIRYENMLKAPKDEFARVINYLNIDLDQQRLDKAISQCSFEQLSKLEENEKKKNIHSHVFTGIKVGSENYSFMNKGQMGRRLSCIEDGLDKKFDLAFKEYLAKFNY